MNAWYCFKIALVAGVGYLATKFCLRITAISGTPSVRISVRCRPAVSSAMKRSAASWEPISPISTFTKSDMIARDLTAPGMNEIELALLARTVFELLGSLIGRQFSELGVKLLR